MRLARFFPWTACLVVGIAPSIAFAQAPALRPGQGHYNLVQANDGKTVGSAEYTLQPLPNGYQVNSQGQLKMDKLSYSFNNANRLDTELNIVRDQLSGTVNGTQVTFDLASDATGRQFQANITAQGKNTTNTFDRHLHTVLLPDLDPAAYVEMAHFAVTHPPTAWIVIPKENGILVPAEYTMQSDVQGTLDGQSVPVHHASVLVSEQNGFSVELYFTGEGQLLEADLPEQNFYVIEDGFKLDSRPHYTPPRGSAPPANQPGQQPYPNQGQPPQYPEPQGGYPPAQPQ
jgi:hypothetical protein